MKISGKTVYLKTNNRLYEVEKSGEKPYTVRILEPNEFYALVNAGIKRVRVEHALDERVFFERDFVSAFMLGEMLGRIFTGIAWKPESCTDERFPKEG